MASATAQGTRHETQYVFNISDRMFPPGEKECVSVVQKHGGTERGHWDTQ